MKLFIQIEFCLWDEPSNDDTSTIIFFLNQIELFCICTMYSYIILANRKFSDHNKSTVYKFTSKFIIRVDYYGEVKIKESINLKTIFPYIHHDKQKKKKHCIDRNWKRVSVNDSDICKKRSGNNTTLIIQTYVCSIRIQLINAACESLAYLF
jgi:hypothetical protein